MGLKMTLTEAQILQSAAAKLTGINIKRVTGFVVATAVGDVLGPLEKFQGERDKAAKDYCKLDDKGAPQTEEIVGRPGQRKLVFKSAAAEAKFTDEISELGNAVIEISVKKRLPLDAFQDPRSEDETCLPWDVLFGLRPILEQIDV